MKAKYKRPVYQNLEIQICFDGTLWAKKNLKPFFKIVENIAKFLYPILPIDSYRISCSFEPSDLSKN